MGVKDRIMQFIKFKELTVAEFERQTGLSNGYIRNISKSIQPEKAKNISNAFPDLNMGWVLTGEGEMLKQDKPQSKSEDTTLMNQLFQSLRDVIETQKKLIDAQSAEIERLQRALGEKEPK